MLMGRNGYLRIKEIKQLFLKIKFLFAQNHLRNNLEMTTSINVEMRTRETLVIHMNNVELDCETIFSLAK